MSVSIQANEIVARVGTELIEGIERLFPENIGRGAPRIPTEPPDAGFLDTFDREARPIGSAGEGYLQFVDGDDLIALAIQRGCRYPTGATTRTICRCHPSAGASLARETKLPIS